MLKVCFPVQGQCTGMKIHLIIQPTAQHVRNWHSVWGQAGRMIDVQESTDDPALTKSKVKYQLLGLEIQNSNFFSFATRIFKIFFESSISTGTIHSPVCTTAGATMFWWMRTQQVTGTGSSAASTMSRHKVVEGRHGDITASRTVVRHGTEWRQTQ